MKPPALAFAPAHRRRRQRHGVRQHLLRTLVVLGLVMGGLLAGAARAAPGSGTAEAERVGGSGNGSRGATLLRVHATRSHMHCPLPGRQQRLIGIDSPAEWEDTIEQQGEIAALGRRVRWSRERVIVFAADMQGRQAEAVRLESPARVIRLSGGVLYWPVRKRTLDDQPPRQVRPCVMAIIDRAFWHRIRVVPTRPL
ncbi:MAG: hypothetical protein L6Q74_01630 [Sphaerotilus natans subsp. sulfidivorans]|uniref:hypothetical protein n=1 Tax=Sphaerotilus sulfidivorans TaxID=639200 RepID=UPI0023572A3A|nr:hypothetical protein [Sphaerotilus sulfidivorans]MCK6400607.1 hypothetical protein [Sphaerotilus sulfidivorans]